MNRILLIIAISAFTLFNCSTKQESNTTDISIPQTLDGVWEMTVLYRFDENGDSTLVDRDGHRQVKMYSNGYVMWSRTVPLDSPQWYGWGGYSVENGQLKEWIEYGSHAFMPWIDPNVPFEHKLAISGDTYIQTFVDENGKPVNSEHYMLISIDTAEPEDDVYPSLQGVWEMTRLEGNTDGNLSEINRTGYRQIKMYHDGYVMWSQQVPTDSVEWFGFGKYSANGGLLTEWMEYGSHSFMPFISEKPFVMELNFSNGGYTQTQKDNEGNEDVKEHYRKLVNEKVTASVSE